jgi:hypothetical protein
MEANFTPAADIITLPSGLYLLTRVGYDDIALVGDLDITAPITITGAGAGVTIVDGNRAVTGDRVFQMLQYAGRVNLSGMTIRNGSMPLFTGGGILYNNPNGGGFASFLDLNNVVLEGNHAGEGAGLYALGVRVGLQNTTVRNNTTTDSGNNGDGGGIFLVDSILTMRDSQVYNNSAVRGGGVAQFYGLTTRIEHSEIYSNTATGSGGGIYIDPHSRLTILNSNLHNNNAGSNGGAISIEITLVISNTVLEANHAALKGGGIFTSNYSNQSISGSTFSHNTAQYGGAIANENLLGTNAIMRLVNSTLSGNSVSHDGAGIYATNNANIQLYNVTIANNVLSRLIGTFNPMRGGGVFFTDTSVITAQNTLIADNYYTNNGSIATPNDCYNTQTTNSLNSLGWNLIETTSNCLISGNTFGNITGQAPQLGPLELNFGATQTQALLPGSPAIDAGQQPACTDSIGAITTDQRAFARPGGTGCDIGAFEYYTVFSAFLPVVQR